VNPEHYGIAAIVFSFAPVRSPVHAGDAPFSRGPWPGKVESCGWSESSPAMKGDRLGRFQSTEAEPVP